MTNPYQPPRVPVEDLSKPGRSIGSVFLLVFGLCCAFIVAMGPTLIVPHFKKTFAAFGLNLPLLTRMVVDYYLWLWLLPIAVIVAHLYWPNPRRRALAACLVGIGGLCLVVPTMFIAFYGPLFALGSTV